MSRKKKDTQATQPYRFWTGEFELLQRLYAEVRPHLRWFWIILLVASTLRFFGITNSSLWMDEIVILQEAFDDQYQTVSYRAHAAHLQPIGFWMHRFGQNAFGVRFWSALLGSLAIPLLFVWGVWTWDKRFGIAVSLLAAANCFLIMYAQDGNYYGGLTFYTVVQLIGFSLLFRGAPFTGFIVTAAASAIGFKTHPIAVIPSAVFLGLMGIGTLVIPSIRKKTFAGPPKLWPGRPGLPIIILATLAAMPWLIKSLPKVIGFLGRVLEPGETTLTNVEFTFPFFRDHVTALFVNFHRMGTASHWAAILMLFLALFGLITGIYTARKQKSPVLGAFLFAAITLPLVSYTILFSISLNRNFNLRYFIYLVPVLSGLVAVAIVSLHEMARRRHYPLILSVPVAICLAFSSRYLLVDKGNYRDGTEYLADQFEPGEKILLPTRNDRIEAQYYLAEADLPNSPPQMTFLNQPEYADLYAGALPAMLNGEQDIWIISAWRYVEAPRMYAMFRNGLSNPFNGYSKWGSQSDFRLYRWDVGSRVLYPGAAGRFDSSGPILVAGAGEWQTNDGIVSFDESGRLESQGVFIPNLPDQMTLSFDDAISPPVHTKMSVIEFEGSEYLRNERDDSYDYLLFQPDHERRLYINLLRRDEEDALLEKNDRPVPSGMTIGVAVDGRHHSLYEVPSGPVEPIRLAVDLDLSPGNHRISISGFSPRSAYTPYFPWCFGGIEWNRVEGNETAQSLMTVSIADGWKSVPNTETVEKQWTIQGNYEVAVDANVPGPAGDASIRIDYPADSKSPFLLLTPPMPVDGKKLCLYSFYYKLEGMDHHELSPVNIFFRADGNPVPGVQFANGPNIRGTTYGKGWVRRQAVVPVPSGAAYMAAGFQSFPLPKGKSSGGSVWLSSFLSPGIDDIQIADPQLPDSYFGFGEEVLSSDD